jgi:hypothetical protein
VGDLAGFVDVTFDAPRGKQQRGHHTEQVDQRVCGDGPGDEENDRRYGLVTPDGVAERRE